MFLQTNGWVMAIQFDSLQDQSQGYFIEIKLPLHLSLVCHWPYVYLSHFWNVDDRIQWNNYGVHSQVQITFYRTLVLNSSPNSPISWSCSSWPTQHYSVFWFSLKSHLQHASEMSSRCPVWWCWSSDHWAHMLFCHSVSIIESTVRWENKTLLRS